MNRLFLHVDGEGFVWYGTSAAAASPAMMRVGAFLDQPLVARADDVRVLGLPSNAALIGGLASRNPLQVVLGSPAICPAGERRDPAFRGVNSNLAPPSAGPQQPDRQSGTPRFAG